MIKDTRFLPIEEREPLDESEEYDFDEELADIIKSRKSGAKRLRTLKLYVAS